MWQIILSIVILGVIGLVVVVLSACVLSGRISEIEEQRMEPRNEADNDAL